MARLVPIPLLVPLIVVACLWAINALPPSAPFASLATRLEWITYDWRVRLTAARSSPYATNRLAAVFITDRSLKAMNDGSYGYREKFPWPVHLYGRLTRELVRQGAEVAGFDVLFELLNPGATVRLSNGAIAGSDEFFATHLREAGNILLAAEPGAEIFPAELFRTNALGIASIATTKDADGVLRATRPFQSVRTWHSMVRYVARGLELDLSHPRFESNRIIVPSMRREVDGHAFPLNPDGSLNLGEIMPGATNNPDGPACSTNRVWNLGVALAAHLLRLDLTKAVVENERIILRGNHGMERIIPLNSDGSLRIAWALNLGDPRIHATDIIELIRNDEFREAGIETNNAPSFTGQLVVIGVAATGGNVTDLGTTPLNERTPLVMQHLNVANSIITGQFIHRPGKIAELLLIAIMAIASAAVTWNLRAGAALASVLTISAGYVLVGALLFVHFWYWLPFVMPLGGALLVTHGCLITIRVREEQRERHRIKSVFSRIVSPNVVNELLKSKHISLQGERRKVSVYFADIRGFTAMTDQRQADAEEAIRTQGLSGLQAEACLEEQAREVLSTVNLYLGVIADTIKHHRGTLDKYIGDCVMAFWGAPASSNRHALDAVLAAMEAQSAVYQLNVQRATENALRQLENPERLANGKPALPSLTLLSLGSGISTGFATVGLMGSSTHLLNYTVFGREVNLASRLEGLSGRGRIIISDATWQELRSLDPALAARCIDLPPQSIKGFRDPVKIYEVLWRELSPETRDYDTGIVKGERFTSPSETTPEKSDH